MGGIALIVYGILGAGAVAGYYLGDKKLSGAVFGTAAAYAGMGLWSQYQNIQMLEETLASQSGALAVKTGGSREVAQ